MQGEQNTPDEHAPDMADRDWSAGDNIGNDAHRGADRATDRDGDQHTGDDGDIRSLVNAATEEVPADTRERIGRSIGAALRDTPASPFPPPKGAVGTPAQVVPVQSPARTGERRRWIAVGGAVLLAGPSP
jgi:hypothetical protein